MHGLKAGLFEWILLGAALVVVSAVILMLAAPTRWVHKITGDRTKTLDVLEAERRERDRN